MRWRVAAAQIPVRECIDENHRVLVEYIAKAAGRKADIVCFPELSLANDEEMLRDVRPEVRCIRRAALHHDINVIFGTYVKEKDGSIRNQNWIVDRQGKVVHKYSKRHAYLTEQAFLKSGRVNKVIKLDGVPMAVINCWDYAFPEEIRSLARRGAKVIFCPSYLLSFPHTKEVLVKIPQVRAFDTMAYFVMVDAFAPDSFRRSKICHPLRELARIEGKPGIIHAELDLDDIDTLRKTFANL